MYLHPNRWVPLPASMGLVAVTRDVFFAVVNPRDVSPSPQGSSRGPHGIYSEWRTRSGALIGMTFTGGFSSAGWPEAKTYMLTPSLAVEGAKSLQVASP